ncbi:L,D-transpeptidase family protein [Microlunatus elymi]|uniref:L,D-transpeptidase family protein n=1 Tax=Microlunatus elymi TaxID=2596828 RepID=UPI001D1890F3|nr:peptidoglycan-binding protein [Microlunatus elymi]
MADNRPRTSRRATQHSALTTKSGTGPRSIRTAAVTSITGALAAVVLVGCGQLPADMAKPGAGASSGKPVASASSSPPGISAAPSSSPSSTKATATTSAAEPAAKPKSTTSTKPSSKHTDKPAAKKTTAPAKIIYRTGDDGQQIRELQARLKQVGWYSGDVTPHYGAQTATAVKGFQDKRDLSPTGVVDEVTWAKLTAMTQQPSHNELYNIEPAGPAIMKQGDNGTKIKQLQARLAQLDWFSEKITGYYGSVTSQAVKGFQDKRRLPATGDVDQKTWDRLVGMTKEPTKDELSGNDPRTQSGGSTSELDQRCLTGRAMCIDKTRNQLVWVIDGKPQLRFDVRFGADTSPTREGAFSVGWKAKDWTSTIYHSKMPYSMFFSGGQAVHYSSDFAARGYAGASHGCVNVRDLTGIQSLFSQAQVGDKVIVYRS